MKNIEKKINKDFELILTSDGLIPVITCMIKTVTALEAIIKYQDEIEKKTNSKTVWAKEIWE